MKRAIVFVVCIAMCGSLLAQDWAKATAPSSNEKLKVGDRLPFKELHNMINYPKKTLKFSDNKPKLIILDFWGTTCKSCVAAWPKTLEIQKEFGADLQIILVDKFEKENYIKEFIKKRKQTTGVDMNMPMSLRDTTIWKYFPQNTVPRYAWITPDGVIASITDGFQFKSENIKKWITSGPFKMPQWTDEFFHVNPTEPIFVDGNGGDSRAEAFIWTSSLSKGQNDVSGQSMCMDNPDRGYSITITGSPIYYLYAIAYDNRTKPGDIVPQHFSGLPKSRIKLNVSDSSIYDQPLGIPGVDRSYNYQLISGRPASRQKMREMMQEDLHRYYGLEVTWEKRKKMCIVWSMFDSTLAHAHKTSIVHDVYVGDDEISLDSVRVRDAIRFMEIGSSYSRSPYPIVDETNYKGLLIGIRYEGNGLDLKEFDQGMSKYGIHIRLEPREVDILVLSERKTPD